LLWNVKIEWYMFIGNHKERIRNKLLLWMTILNRIFMLGLKDRLNSNLLGNDTFLFYCFKFYYFLYFPFGSEWKVKNK